MALELAGSLIEQHTFDPADVLSRYVRWWQTDGVDSGPISAGVLARVAQGVDPRTAVDSVDRDANGMTAGCNPAHRSVPLAMAAFLPDDQLASIAAAEAALTHKHPLAGDVSACVVVLCRALISGRSWSEALDLAATQRSNEVVLALSQAALRPGGMGGYAPEVQQTAVHFVGSAPDFKSAWESSLRYSGRANYSPVLVGAIGGARWGAAQAERTLAENRRVTEVASRVFSIAQALEATWL